MRSLSDAVDAMSARKTAIAGETPGFYIGTEDRMRLLLSGFDLDPYEVKEEADEQALTAMFNVLRGAPPVAVMAGDWIDGMLTGLMLAELRRLERPAREPEPEEEPEDVPRLESLTPEFSRAFHRVVRDVQLDDGRGADLIAVGVQRSDCLTMLYELVGDEDPPSATTLVVIVQWAVAVGVWLERARWEDPPDEGA